MSDKNEQINLPRFLLCGRSTNIIRRQIIRNKFLFVLSPILLIVSSLLKIILILTDHHTKTMSLIIFPVLIISLFVTLYKA